MLFLSGFELYSRWVPLLNAPKTSLAAHCYLRLLKVTHLVISLQLQEKKNNKSFILAQRGRTKDP